MEKFYFEHPEAASKKLTEIYERVEAKEGEPLSPVLQRIADKAIAKRK